jgi:nitrate/nitrite transport system permease protein
MENTAPCRRRYADRRETHAASAVPFAARARHVDPARHLVCRHPQGRQHSRAGPDLGCRRALFADPFYRNGPNDQGIGWNVLSSLQRVGIGFGFAALVGIPLGFILGRSAFLSAMINPIISLLRPVSPLAWLPIGLLVFKKADPAATYTIFICSIWPMIMNTAQGVQRVPQDYLNVARVLALSEWKVVTKILFPAVLPYMLTGIRLSIGTAWLVIVAAEMLTGGVGIGFWVWDEWNNLKVEHIIIAIFVIGIVGLILEQALILLAKKLTKESS